MRQILNRNTNATMVVAGAVIVLCLIFVISQLFSSDNKKEPKQKPRVPQVWFYDRNTKELFLMPLDTVGPVERESGPYDDEPAGVRAMVFACGSCGDSDKQFIGWLERPSPNISRIGEEGITESDLIPLIAEPGIDGWVVSDSDKAGEIQATAFDRCPKGTSASFCSPKSHKMEEIK